MGAWHKPADRNSKIIKARGNMRMKVKFRGQIWAHRETWRRPYLLPAPDVHTSMHSVSFHPLKTRLTVWCLKQWHICTSLLPLCNHTNCFHIRLVVFFFPAQKDSYLKVQTDRRHIRLFEAPVVWLTAVGDAEVLKRNQEERLLSKHVRTSRRVRK